MTPEEMKRSFETIFENYQNIESSLNANHSENKMWRERFLKESHSIDEYEKNVFRYLPSHQFVGKTPEEVMQMCKKP